MKLMNEIPSPELGRVAKICVEDGEAVEYGQTIMWLEPLQSEGATGAATKEE
jgi:biotin carboxyl carrier protein